MNNFKRWEWEYLDDIILIHFLYTLNHSFIQILDMYIESTIAFR